MWLTAPFMMPRRTSIVLARTSNKFTDQDPLPESLIITINDQQRRAVAGLGEALCIYWVDPVPPDRRRLALGTEAQELAR
jgi:hypothetical protein